MIDPFKPIQQELSAAKESNDSALEEITRTKEELDMLGIQEFELPEKYPSQKVSKRPFHYHRGITGPWDDMPH